MFWGFLHDLTLGEALFQFEAVKEVPDGRVGSVDDIGKPIVPPLRDIAAPGRAQIRGGFTSKVRRSVGSQECRSRSFRSSPPGRRGGKYERILFTSFRIKDENLILPV